jgi:hypothetical protein
MRWPWWGSRGIGATAADQPTARCTGP